MRDRFLVILLLCATFGLSACSMQEKKAQTLLQKAQTAFLEGDLEQSKTLIDSIKVLYPKAYDTRHKGNDLYYRVDSAMQERTISYLNAALDSLDGQISERCKALILDKDGEYETQGHWMADVQRIERNLSRSFVRFQCLEDGQMSMTTTYVGSDHIHHTAVKVTAADGTFAQTPTSRDSYETEDLGKKIEKADFKLGQDGGFIDFCALHASDRSLQIEYLGQKSYKTVMTKADLDACLKVLELSKALTASQEARSRIEEARTRLQFIERLKTQKRGKEE